MKAMIILGSPRGKNSSSYNVAQNFISGLKKSDVEIEEIILKDYSINPCRGCLTCWLKTPGKCVYKMMIWFHCFRKQKQQI